MSQVAASEQQQQDAAAEAQALYDVFGPPSPPEGSEEEGPPASPAGAGAAGTPKEQQPRPAPRGPHAADELAPTTESFYQTVRALSLGLRRQPGSSTPQQGSPGELPLAPQRRAGSVAPQLVAVEPPLLRRILRQRTALLASPQLAAPV